MATATLDDRYAARVRRNFDFMGTPAGEWSAVPVTGTAEVSTPNGAVSMPVFSFPEGYAHGKTLYPSNGNDPCCELCGTAIKRVYWIQNDARLLTLSVGSECVTHFGEGKSGERLTKEQRWEANRQLARDAQAIHSRVRRELNPNAWGLKQRAALLLKAIGPIVGKVAADQLPGYSSHHGAPSTDAVLTRWETKHGASVREWIEQGRALVALPEWREAYREKLLAEVRAHRQELANGRIAGESWNRYRINLVGPAREAAEREVARLEALIDQT